METNSWEIVLLDQYHHLHDQWWRW